MKKNYKLVGVKYNPLTKIKNIFYGIAALCFVNSAANAQVGAALNFDGVNDNALRPIFSTATNSITIEAKVFWNGPSAGNKIIVNNGNTGGNGYGFFIPGGSSTVNWIYGGIAFNGAFTLTPGVWTSMAMVITSNTITIYKDGVVVVNGAVGVPATPVGFFSIGSDQTGGGNFNGSIDEVRFWNVARTPCEIISFLNCEIPTAATGLLANYHFNQGIAAGANATVTNIADASGNNNNITTANFALTGATSNWVAPGGVVSGFTNVGTCASSLNFDGVNDNALRPVLTTATNSITIEAKVLWNGPSSGNKIIVHNGNTGGNGYGFFIPSTSSTVNWIYGGIAFNSAFTLTPGVWTSMAMVITSNTITIYKDGVVVVNAAVGSPATPAGFFSIGSDQAGAGNFNGSIDEVRFWNVARTKCEILSFLNCEIPTAGTGLLANYHFNQGIAAGSNATVTNIADASGNNNNITTANFALTGATSNWVATGGVVSNFTTAAALNPTVSSTVTNSVICNGNSTILNGTGANTYVWTGGVTNNVSFSPTVTAQYTVTGTATLTGCTNTAVNTVTVNSNPTITINSGAICNGNSFTMIPTGANTYTFSSGSAIVTPTTNTSYSVTGTSSAGCVSNNTAVSNVTVNALPTVSVNSGAICSGNSFTMTPTGASTYTFSNGNAVATPTSNSSYNVTGTSAAGCVSSNTAISNVTVNVLPSISASSNASLICIGQTASLTASGALSYTWNTAATTTVIAITPNTTTSYTVNGTDANGCSNLSVITQSVSACTGINSINETEAVLNIFPNPSNGIVTIEIPSQTNISVFDALGKLVYTQQLLGGSHVINLSNFNNGLYILKAQSTTSTKTIRLIKE